VSGDATLNNSGVLTLASVVTAGSCTSCNLTYNAKGLITAASNGSAANPTIVNGGNTAYSILSGDGHIIPGVALTANRTYTLPLCTSSNFGEHHEVANSPYFNGSDILTAQTDNIIVAGNTSDTVDGASTYTLNPYDSASFICESYDSTATQGEWAVQ
jgi:hypothetical protein